MQVPLFNPLRWGDGSSISNRYDLFFSYSLSHTLYIYCFGDRKKTAYINNRVKHILVQNLTRNVLHVYTLSSVPTSNINCFWEVIVTKFFFCHSLQNLPKPSHFHSVIFHSRTFSSWVLQAFKPGTFLVFFQVKDIL